MQPCLNSTCSMCNELGVCQGSISHKQWTDTIRWRYNMIIGSCSVGIHNYIMPMNTGYFTHTLHNMTFFQNTPRIHGRILWHIFTDHDRWLYIQYRSLPATLYTFYTIMYMSMESTKNTRSCTMTQTGHDRRLDNQYRSLPATLYTFYTIMWNTSECTKNTRSCTMTHTGHDRRLYNQYRSLPATLYTFYTIMWNTSECTKNTRSCTMT